MYVCMYMYIYITLAKITLEYSGSRERFACNKKWLNWSLENIFQDIIHFSQFTRKGSLVTVFLHTITKINSRKINK